MKERLLQAYFHDGLDIGDPDVLADVRGRARIRPRPGAGVPRLERRCGARSPTDIERATELGITAVPTYVINGSGRSLAHRTPTRSSPCCAELHERITVEPAPACDDDICDV